MFLTFFIKLYKEIKIWDILGLCISPSSWSNEHRFLTKHAVNIYTPMFLSRDDKPYCADCFGELFSKRCTACAKPITGNLYFRHRFGAANLNNTYSRFRHLGEF